MYMLRETLKPHLQRCYFEYRDPQWIGALH
jgi:hypothetical protein